MNRKWWIQFLFILFVGGLSTNLSDSPVFAQQIQLCSVDQENVMTLNSKELRAIASNCSDSELARLYYNRAYHQDLLNEAEFLSQLISYRHNSAHQHMINYRLYIAMVELFARHSLPKLEVRAVYLNEIYDKYDEVAMLRIRGYDKTADNLEREIILRDN